ncbi:hypothetical protein J2Y86_002708 [Pseudomonas migulae]|nr:hypothetical protein [Pseudomonas migulae]
MAMLIGDPPLSDAILDRRVPSFYQIELKGESMLTAKLTAAGT